MNAVTSATSWLLRSCRCIDPRRLFKVISKLFTGPTPKPLQILTVVLAIALLYVKTTKYFRNSAVFSVGAPSETTLNKTQDVQYGRHYEYQIPSSKFFPIEDIPLNVPLNGPTVLEHCYNDRAETFIFISSYPTQSRDRDFYRRSLTYRILTVMGWSMAFFVGISDKSMNLNTIDEAYKHGDLVVLPFADTVVNQTYKFVYGLRWVLDNCPHVSNIVMITGTTFLHPLNVKTYISKMSPSDESLHCATVLHRTSLVHCRSWAMMLNRRSADKLHVASLALKPTVGYEIYTTGELVAAAYLKHNNISAIVYQGGVKKMLAVARGDYTFAVFNDLQVRDDVWKTMLMIDSGGGRRNEDVLLGKANTMRSTITRSTKPTTKHANVFIANNVAKKHIKGTAKQIN